MSERPTFLTVPDLDPMFAAELRRRGELRAREERDTVLTECSSLAGFVRNAWHVLEPTTAYVHNWHIDAVCAHLEAVSDGFIRRLVINVPPGTMKSLLVSVLWPAWEWGPRGLPHLRYLSTSYEQELALRDNRKMRNLIESDWYQELWGDKVRLARDQRAKGKFENTASGVREARAFTSLTGGRGDRVLIDDPHSTKGADSDAQRDEVETLIEESLPSRVNDPVRSAIVLIMQRLHERDATATFLKVFPDAVHLRLPMEFEKDPMKQSDGTLVGGPCRTRLGPGRIFVDPRQEEGDPLFPGRYPPATVAGFKRSQYVWAGQYQQRPGPREGALFKVDMIELVNVAPPPEKTVRSWDLAGSKPKAGTDPDWTAGGKIAKGRDGVFYILDVRRWRERPGKTRELIKGVASQDGHGVYITVPKDPAQAGIDQVNSYATALAGYMLKARPPSGSKELRAEPFASMVELGLVRMVRGPWNEDLLNELRAFPSGAHDDQVDALSDAFNELTGIVPGEGLLEFYRQEAEAAALRALGGETAAAPGTDASHIGKLGVIPPAGTQLAFGGRGAMYRPDSLGVMWVDPEDAAILLRQSGWGPYQTPDVGGE